MIGLENSLKRRFEMFEKFKRLFGELPDLFWIVAGIRFIDRLGGTILVPFFSLYITDKFNVGMTEAGIVLGLYALSGMLGQIMGGALTDRFGRKNLIIVGLVLSALSTLTLGLVNEYILLIPAAIFIGIFSDIAKPAHQAMIADIVTEKQRTDSFGVLRISTNLAWIIGPMVGGFIAGRSYFALFVLDAVLSVTVAILFFIFVPETTHRSDLDEMKKETLFETIKGYRIVFRDVSFAFFVVIGIVRNLVVHQLFDSFSVYLRDVHGYEADFYGILMAINAAAVVLFQLWITRRVKQRAPFLMIAFGTGFYMVGFGMFGFVSSTWLFIVGMLIVTVGEMVVMPIQSALAVSFASKEMIGRYMAVFGFVWMIPAIFGPYLAGLVFDNLNPNMLWYGSIVLTGIAMVSYVMMNQSVGKESRFEALIEK